MRGAFDTPDKYPMVAEDLRTPNANRGGTMASIMVIDRTWAWVACPAASMRILYAPAAVYMVARVGELKSPQLVRVGIANQIRLDNPLDHDSLRHTWGRGPLTIGQLQASVTAMRPSTLPPGVVSRNGVPRREGDERASRELRALLVRLGVLALSTEAPALDDFAHEPSVSAGRGPSGREWHTWHDSSRHEWRRMLGDPEADPSA